MKGIIDKTCAVCVIHPSQSVRVELRSTVNNIGFVNVHTGASVSDAKKFQLQFSDGWVLMPMFATAKETGIEFMRASVANPKASKFRTTFFADDVDFNLLVEAFEHGLLSWYKGSLNKKMLTEHIQDVIGSGIKSQGSATMVAAEFLRKYLAVGSDFDNVFRLEKNLHKLFPSDGRPLYNMAKALFSKRHYECSRSSFKQAVYLSPELTSEAHAYLENMGTPEALNIKASIGFKSALLVDPDRDILKALTEILSDQFKVSEIRAFENGEAAWQSILDGFQPTMIFQEWKIPKLSGPQFIQRVRHHGLSEARIMVVSSLLQKSDIPLLQEMFVYDVLPKPFQRQNTIAIIERILREESFPNTVSALMKKINEAITMRDYRKARELKVKMTEMTEMPTGQDSHVEAEILYHEKQYDLAKNTIFKSIRTSGKESAHSLNLLGKVLLALNELDSALKVFERAQVLSPNNITRLCSIATIHTEAGRIEQAEEVVAKASAIDANALSVKESEVKIAMAEGDKRTSQAKMKDLENIQSIVSQMNNRAVAYVRTNAIAKALELYQQTLDALPRDDREMRARVLYNLGLANVRANDLKAANGFLQKAEAIGPPEMKAKIGSLNKKVMQSMNSGKRVQLTVDVEMVAKDQEVDIFEQIYQEGIGDSKDRLEPQDVGRCLHKIFYRAG